MQGPTEALGTNLDRLEELVRDVVAGVERLGLLHHDDQISIRFRELIDLNAELREHWSAIVSPPASTREELRERVARLGGPARLRALAQVLEAATLTAPDDRLQRRWERDRGDAVHALRELAEAATPPTLPGPTHDARAWYPWAWQQRSSPTWGVIEAACPQLFDFLDRASPDGWFPQDDAAAEVAPKAPDHQDEVAPHAETPGTPEVPPVQEPLPDAQRDRDPRPDEPRTDETPQPTSPADHSVGPHSHIPPVRGTEAPRKREAALLSDDALASLFVSDPVEAARNIEHHLPAANREKKRQRDKFVQTECRAEWEKRKRRAASPTPQSISHPASSERMPPRIPPLISALPMPTGRKAEPSPEPPPPPIDAGEQPPANEPAKIHVSLVGFEEFRRTHWTGSGGCRPAPWTRPEFPTELAVAAESAAVAGDLATLHVLVRAQEALGEPPLVFPHDVETIHRLLSARDPALVGRSDERRRRIDEAARTSELTDDLCWQTSVLLECLRPADSAVGQPPAPSVLHAVALEPVWEDFAAELNTATRRGMDLLEAARSWQSDAHAEVDVDELRRQLKKLFRDLYNAAGGRIERTHCREAWSQFAEAAKPTLEPLFPVGGGGSEDLALDDLATRVRRLPTMHTKIADRAGALRGDRRDMDKAASALTDAAQSVIEAMRRERTRSEQNTPWQLSDPSVVTSVVDRPGDPLRLVGSVVKRLLQLCPPSEAGLPMERLRSHPELLELLEPETVSEHEARATAADLADPVRAASLLMRPAAEGDGDGDDTLVNALSSRQLNHLLPRMKAALDETRREAVQRQQADTDDEVLELQGRLQALFTGHEHLGSAHATRISALIADSEDLVRRDAVSDSRMLLGWLEATATAAATGLREEWQAQLEKLSEPQRTEIGQLVDEERWVEAARRVGGFHPPQHHLNSRVTRFRDDAAREFADPVQSLHALSTSPQDKELVQRWLEAPTDKTKLRTLRSRFATFLGLPDAVDRVAEDITVDSASLRHQIDQDGMNPCFVPQLTQLRELRIETIDMPADRTHFSNLATQRLAKPAPENPLRIALTPRLTPTNREQLLSMLHQKKAMAVVVDDLDLCRLLLARQEARHMMLGLLEIALEQLPIEKVVPFETAEGQHTPPEMFVGREQEARNLATTKTYTRVFSGRKLGKSALLRAVQHRFADRPLPLGGKRLKVLYVSLVGTSEERDVVDEILGAVRRDLGLDLPAVSDETPRQRLSRCVLELGSLRPDEFFFFVCDESDQFVESEIRTFQEHRREHTLSWAMRALEQHPVRFVFAGYRSTHRNEGAWENWGEPLMLRPLEREEAEQLIAGPLARIGVDVSSMAASIAHRCGFQPAILLKFGRALLDEVRKDSAGFGRGGTLVEPMQVSRAFAQTLVQDEIRTVVMANFHGNPLAQVVFCATLLELSDLPAGAVLMDASDRVVRRIDEIAGGQRWTPPERNAGAFVEETLRELADRQLLDAGGRGAFRLRIPHHLGVLLEEDPERVIRDHLRSIAAGTITYERPWKGLLEPGSLDRIRETLDNADDLGLAAVVAGTSWQAALRDRNGLQRALGVTEDDPRFVGDCTPTEAANLVAGGSGRVLFGGPELIRWAIERDADPDFEHLLEIVELRRVPRAGLGWWLQRAHGIEFVDQGSIERLWTSTQGVPDLVGIVDRRLMSLGDTLGAHHVELALNEVQAHLRKGGPAFLDEADRRFLRLVLRVADALVDPSSGDERYAHDLGDALTDPEMLRDVGLTEDECRTIEDAPRLRYLLAIGWLPRLDEAIGPFHAIAPVRRDDPVRTLLGA